MQSEAAKVKYLILCPLATELKFIVKTLQDEFAAPQIIEIQQGSQIRKYSYFAELNLACAVGGHGKAEFALRSQFWCSQFPSLSYLICCGCAGSLDKNLKPGYLVIASHIVEHDYNLKFIDRPLPKTPTSFNKDMFERLKEHSKQSVHFQMIASGDEDIVESQRAKDLARKTRCHAVTWESAGGIRTAQFNALPYIEVRGITDLCDKDAKVSFDTNLPVAMSQAAKCILQMIKEKII